MKSKIIKTEIYRVIASPLFWISFIIIIVFCYMSCYEEIRYIDTNDVEYIFDLMLGLGSFKNMIIFAASIPYMASFCSDWNNKFIQSVAIRSGVSSYAKSKLIVNIITTFLLVFLSLISFVLLLNLKMPLTYQDINSGVIISKPYGYILMGNSPIIYFIIRSFLISISAVFWCTVGLYISSYIPNNFVAISTPFISFYLLGEIGEFLPHFFNFRMLAYGFDVINKGALITIIYTLVFFTVLTLIVGMLFIRNVKRRVGNELI